MRLNAALTFDNVSSYTLGFEHALLQETRLK